MEKRSSKNTEEGKAPLKIRLLEKEFSVCRLNQLSEADLTRPFAFSAVTDEEISLVTLSENVPDDPAERSDGWRGMRIEGQLEFSLTGILAGITDLLAEEKIPVFAVSTFRTDYIFVQAADYEHACFSLEKAGYLIIR